ncbi:MAG: hypothetical protein HUU22_16370 [Phycisphaerae bacterium]|nr:queuosine salvage family protein [Phycisphaerae bacterium]NUQ47596.1 hypothetical protein [Phycisphaerae bacterium]
MSRDGFLAGATTPERVLELTPADLLSSVRRVTNAARHVAIDDAAIEAWAVRFDSARLASLEASPLDDVTGSPAEIARFVLLIDALNFCFWSHQPIETTWRGRRVVRYTAFVALMAEAVQREHRWLEPAYWSEVDAAKLRRVVAGAGELLMIEERAAVLRETGRVLLERFGGSLTKLAEASNHRAWRVALMLADSFPSFRDVAEHAGRRVWLLKRAQICAMDLSTAWTRRGWPGLSGLDDLTAFADYRIPQILRHLGILRVAPALAERIEARRGLAAGSVEEVELRAATIDAVDRMRQAVAKRGNSVPAWRIDVALWEDSHAADVSVEHHRVCTIYY